MILVGTSGFSFPDWKGTIYPKGIRDSEMLPFYERELGFKALEVNFTYYTLPSQNSFIGMSRKTSDNFQFVVKAFKGMTHEIRDKKSGKLLDNREIFDKFNYSLQPLKDQGKIGCVLAQFPFSFFPSRQNLEYLSYFRQQMEDIPLVVEFRNRYWIRESTFQFLEKRGLGYCIVDEPRLPKLMPFFPRATTDLGYFRFHGRNPKWFSVPISVRYDYLYSKEEMKELVPAIQKISRQTPQTLVFFNNCHAGSAARNAVEMARMLF